MSEGEHTHKGARGAKKSLGQNFLRAPNVIQQIVHTANIQPDEVVLEIGPGKGALTEAILAAGTQVIAVEKDESLEPLLQEKFAQNLEKGQLQLVIGDILEKTPENLGISDKKYLIIANIPYYITGEILRKFLENTPQPSRMILMVQKEVANRIVCRDGKESILSASVKAYGAPKYIETVKARFFRPIPKVDSAVLLIDSISKDFFKEFGITEQQFFDIVHAGFAHKRKFVVNNLENLVAATTKNEKISPKEQILKIFENLTISPKIRAEEIDPKMWAKIAQKVFY